MKKPFQVGERVAVYGTSGNFKPVRGAGVVEAVLDGGMVRFEKNHSLYRKYDPDAGGWDLTLVHAKQCRRLVKRERRRVWVVFHNNPSQVKWAAPGHEEAESNLRVHRANGYDGEIVEFIEVRKK